MNHYLDRSYLQTLQQFGTPLYLENCGGSFLSRPIPGSSSSDLMGSYPFLVCRDWSKLPSDLQNYHQSYVCASFVTDPFGDFSPLWMEQVFPDRFIPFKEHFIVDLDLPLEKIGGKRRRQHARKALRKLDLEVCHRPLDYADEWIRLYDALIQKHDIQGLRAFSKEAFINLFEIPGIVMLRAAVNGSLVAAQVYLTQGDIVHAHLGACSPEGYALEATYALDWFSFEYFKGKARYLDLGGGLGVRSDGTDGLSVYKRLWATDTRMTYFCGTILNRADYQALLIQMNNPNTTYFPAYRAGEFQ